MTEIGLDSLIGKLENVSDESLSLSKDEKSALLEAFCRVDPPTVPETEHRMELILVSGGGRKGGVSVKPGNISLNWPKLISALPAIVLTGAGAAANPWLICLGALVIWRDLYSTAKIDLGQQHAVAILTMWENHDGNRRISEETARRLTNNALAEFDLNELSQGTFAKIIDDLSAAGCIKLSEGEIWLREWIRRRWP